jgi:hypothetical protein
MCRLRSSRPHHLDSNGATLTFKRLIDDVALYPTVQQQRPQPESRLAVGHPLGSGLDLGENAATITGFRHRPHAPDSESQRDLAVKCAAQHPGERDRARVVPTDLSGPVLERSRDDVVRERLRLGRLAYTTTSRARLYSSPVARRTS